MRDNEQRVALVERRARQICRRREKHMTERLSVLSVVLCSCLIFTAGYCNDKTPHAAVQGFSGATMLLENAGGYVLVGVLCFVAAVVITVLCIRLRERSCQQGKQSKEDRKI